MYLPELAPIHSFPYRFSVRTTSFRILGMNMEISGIYVTSIRATTIAAKNGRSGRDTLTMVVLPTPHPTNKQVPTGGVHSPIQRLAIMIIPKWTGCRPMLCATGRKMGVKMRTAGVISMNVPTNRSRVLIISRITILFPETDSSAALTFCGIF